MNKQIINLMTDGKVKTKDREFTRVIGGFGENNPMFTIWQTAELLGKATREIIQNYNNNASKFETGIDVIDLKSAINQNDSEMKPNVVKILKDIGYSQNKLNATKQWLSFSFSGIMKVVKIVESEEAWDIYNNFLEDYFKTKAENKILKATIQEQIRNLKETYYITFGKGIATGDNKLLMESQNINNQIIELEKRLTEELTVKKYKIYEDKYKQFMDSDNCFSFENASKILSTTANGEGLDIKVNKITLPKILRNKGILSKERKGNGYKNIPNSKYEEYFNVTTYEFEKNGQTHNKVKSTITSKGLDFIYNLLKEDNKIA